MTPSHNLRLPLLALAAAALTLAACGKQDDRTVGQKLDSAVAKVEQKTDQAKAEVKQEMAEARTSTVAAAGSLADKVESATGKMAGKIESASENLAGKAQDAAITAKVNAELAKDDTLSAMKINVDTVNGEVLLKGTAPDTGSRERATRLAAAIKGVTKVDNRLEVRG